MSKSTCSQAWVGAHSGNRVKSEPRRFANLLSPLPSHQIMKWWIYPISFISFLCVCLALPCTDSRPIFLLSVNTMKVWFKRLVLIVYIQLKAGRIMKMRMTGTEHNILNTSSESDPSWKAMIESLNWSLTISQYKILQIRVKHSPEILVQAELDVWLLPKILTTTGGSKF